MRYKKNNLQDLLEAVKLLEKLPSTTQVNFWHRQTGRDELRSIIIDYFDDETEIIVTVE